MKGPVVCWRKNIDPWKKSPFYKQIPKIPEVSPIKWHQVKTNSAFIRVPRGHKEIEGHQKAPKEDEFNVNPT